MKKKVQFIALFSFLLMAFASLHPLQTPDYQIPYPQGFREWTHIKTLLTGLHKNPQEKFDGWHHIYANDIAMTGYRSGTFPEGSIIVFDKHEVDTIGGVLQSGKRKFINLMIKNSDVFKETGGWGFEEFTGNSKTEGRLTSIKALNCFKGCHQAKSNTDFVFSKLND